MEHLCGHPLLSCMRFMLVDKRMKWLTQGTKGLSKQCVRVDREGEQELGVEEALDRYGCGNRRTIKQGKPFLWAQTERQQAKAFQSGLEAHGLAIAIDREALVQPYQGSGNVCQWDEITTGTDRPELWHIGCDVSIQEGDKSLDELQAGSRSTLHEAVRPQ